MLPLALTLFVLQFGTGIYPPEPCATRSCALSVLLHNLSLLSSLSSQAPPGSLVLFPEDSLSGPAFTSRDQLRPYTEEFPPTGSTIPCPHRNSVLSAISCLSIANNITIIANLGERVNDTNNNNNNNNNNSYYYNTDVVVSGGVLVAKYRKRHLYYEVWDRGGREPVSFVVGGVKIGLLTCNDLTFPDLIGELVGGGVEVILAPSWWVNTPPVMTGVAFFAGFSATWGVTLAVSGSGGSGWASSGAGVWHRGETLASFYSQDMGEDSTMLVKVMVPASASTRAWTRRRSEITKDPLGFVSFSPLLEEASSSSSFSQTITTGPQFSCSVAGGWSTRGPLFAVAMSGNVSSLYPIFSQWPVQFCGVIPCDTTSGQCQLDSPVLESKGTLEWVAVNATFDHQLYRVFPVVIGQGGQGVNLTTHCQQQQDNLSKSTSLSCIFPAPSQSLSTSLLALPRNT